MAAIEGIESDRRFEFGANWARFLTVLDDERIRDAENSLKEMLRVDSLEGESFLDVGCGSGLFSLAARRLGARVLSFDFDVQSVSCAQELRRRYFPDDRDWRVEKGSVLDRDYMQSLGQFDIVYSWGVLHHTGAMWLGLEHAINRVERKEGKLFIAIYNDQGWKSHVWWLVKSFCNRLPGVLKPVFVALVTSMTQLLVFIKYLLKLQPMIALKPLFTDRRERGMSARCDNLDWIGGFPFEVASPEALEAYCAARGFRLLNAKRTTSWGCNELAFQRVACAE